jgi:hypothetical protein
LVWAWLLAHWPIKVHFRKYQATLLAIPANITMLIKKFSFVAATRAPVTVMS